MEHFEPTEEHKLEGTRLCFDLKEVCDEYGPQPFTWAALVTCASLWILSTQSEDEYADECGQAFNDAQRPGGPRPGPSPIAAALRMDEQEKALTEDATDAIVRFALEYSTFVFFHCTLVYAATLSLESADSEDAFKYLARQAYRASMKQHRDLRQPVAQA